MLALIGADAWPPEFCREVRRLKAFREASPGRKAAMEGLSGDAGAGV
jgi:hypothetical protein